MRSRHACIQQPGRLLSLNAVIPLRRHRISVTLNNGRLLGPSISSSSGQGCSLIGFAARDWQCPKLVHNQSARLSLWSNSNLPQDYNHFETDMTHTHTILFYLILLINGKRQIWKKKIRITQVSSAVVLKQYFLKRFCAEPCELCAVRKHSAMVFCVTKNFYYGAILRTF